MHAEIGPARGADGGDLWRWRLLAFGGRRSRRRRSSRLRCRGGRLSGCGRRRWRCGGWRRWCCSCGRWCGLRGCRRWRRALCRRRSNGVERRLARWRYFGGIALETFERVLGARLHAGALRHEVGAAGGADRRNLLGRRLLGRGRQAKSQPRARLQSTGAQRANSRTSRKPPFLPAGTLHNRANAVQHAVYCRSASALRLRTSLLIQLCWGVGT